MYDIVQKKISGWNEKHFYKCNIFKPNNIDHLKKFIKNLKKGTTIIARGHGCSSGDQAINTDGVVIDFLNINKILEYKANDKKILVEGGAKLTEILSVTIKDNLIFQSIPGGLEMTVAGAISNNVHGKDCFKNGYFENNVNEITILQTSGNLLKLSKTSNPELFQNFFGSCGLLGIILSVEINLKKISSNLLKIESKIANNESDMKKYFDNLDETKDFAVAWLDCYATDKDFMRGIFRTASFTNELNTSKNDKKILTQKNLKFFKQRKENFLVNFFLLIIWRSAGFLVGSKIFKLLNPLAFFIFKFFKKNKISLQVLPEFVGMANKYLPSHNYLFKPNGFITIQPFFDDFNKIAEVIKICHKFNIIPIWCPIKKYKFKKKNPLDFGGNGFSIVIEFSSHEHGENKTRNFISELNNKIIEQGGHYYLAKDEIIDSNHFKSTYPKYNEFLDIKKKYDPETILISEQFKRLFK